MIADTTYLLPLAGIAIDTDLLKAMDEGKARFNLREIAINLISIFELQVKAAKTNIPVEITAEAVDVILSEFKVKSFYDRDVIEISQELLPTLVDYFDCLIVATAITLHEVLVTEDSRILAKKKHLKQKYEIEVCRYQDTLI